MTQAPSRNLDTRTTTSVTPVQTAPAALIAIDFRACAPPSAPPVHDHPRLRERERQERPDREQRDQMIGDAAEGDQESRREHRQDEDALRVDEPAASVGEPARAENRPARSPGKAAGSRRSRCWPTGPAR